MIMNCMYKDQTNTRDSMVSASLHVESRQIQSQLSREFKQSVSQLLRHHVILCVQLSHATHKPPHDWVQTTWKQKI